MQQHLMFLIFLYIPQICAITTVQFDLQQQWQQTDKVTRQNIYFIPRFEHYRYFVNVVLEQEDPEFNLIVTLDQQFNPNNNTIIAYFDWIGQREFNYDSQIENRLTRFIKFEPLGKVVFIEIKGSITQEYNITVTATNGNLCPSDCNHNGICQINGCQCNENFVGNDCHQRAEEILLDSEKTLTLYADEYSYFYIPAEEQRTSGSSNLTLLFEVSIYLNKSNNPNNTMIVLEKTNVLMVPDNFKFSNDDNKFYYQLAVNSSIPLMLSIQIDQNNIQPIVFVAKSIGLNSQLQINKNIDSEESTSTLVIWIVCPIAGSIVMAIGLFYTIKNWQEIKYWLC